MPNRLLRLALLSVIPLFAAGSPAGFPAASPAVPYQVGQTVAARWSNWSWYLARVTAVKGEWYDVAYADGDKGKVRVEGLRAIEARPALRAGDRVLAVSSRARFWPGEVVALTGYGPLVKWDDGSPATHVAWSRVIRTGQARVPLAFSYTGPARTVTIAGDHNGWRTNDAASALRRGADGVWRTTLALAPGALAYQYIVDGKPFDMWAGWRAVAPDPEHYPSATTGYASRIMVPADARAARIGKLAGYMHTRLFREWEYDAAWAALAPLLPDLAPVERQYLAYDAAVACFWRGLAACGAGDYPLAARLLAEADACLRLHYPDVAGCGLADVRALVARRLALGTIRPEATARMALVHVPRAEFDGKAWSMVPGEERRAAAEWGWIRCFVELHSAGKLSVVTESFTVDGKFTGNWSGSRVPRLDSLKPYPVMLFYKIAAGFDGYFVYQPCPPQWSSAAGAPEVVPGRMTAGPYGAMLWMGGRLAADDPGRAHACFHRSPGWLPLHEWTHCIEWWYGQSQGPLYGHPWTLDGNPYRRDWKAGLGWPWNADKNPYAGAPSPEMKYYETLFGILLPKVIKERGLTWASNSPFAYPRRPETPDAEFMEYLEFRHTWTYPAGTKLKVACGMRDKDGRPDTVVVRGAGCDVRRVDDGESEHWSLSRTAWRGPKRTSGHSYWWEPILFRVTLPPRSAGVLRLFFREPAPLRRQEVFLNGKFVRELRGFGEPGTWVEFPLGAADTATGGVDVRVFCYGTSPALLSGIEVLGK